MVTGFAYGDGFTGLSNTTDPTSLYVRGSEFVEGSLRMSPEPRNDKFVRFERRTNDTWNNTGIEIAAESINIGQDLILSAAGRYIDSTDLVRGVNGLASRHEYDDFGSVPQPVTPILGPIQIELAVQPDDTSEVSGTVIVSEIFAGGPPRDLLGSKSYFRIGSIAATAPVTLTLHRGLLVGPSFFQIVVPEDDVGVAESQFEVETDGLIPITSGELITIEFVSANVFSLKSDSSGLVFFSADVREVVEEEILTESLVLGNDLSVAFANDGSLARHNHNFA